MLAVAERFQPPGARYEEIAFQERDRFFDTAIVSKHADTTQQPAVVAKQSELVSHILRKGKPQH